MENNSAKSQINDNCVFKIPETTLFRQKSLHSIASNHNPRLSGGDEGGFKKPFAGPIYRTASNSAEKSSPFNRATNPMTHLLKFSLLPGLVAQKNVLEKKKPSLTLEFPNCNENKESSADNRAVSQHLPKIEEPLINWNEQRHEINTSSTDLKVEKFIRQIIEKICTRCCSEIAPEPVSNESSVSKNEKIQELVEIIEETCSGFEKNEQKVKTDFTENNAAASNFETKPKISKIENLAESEHLPQQIIQNLIQNSETSNFEEKNVLSCFDDLSDVEKCNLEGDSPAQQPAISSNITKTSNENLLEDTDEQRSQKFSHDRKISEILSTPETINHTASILPECSNEISIEARPKSESSPKPPSPDSKQLNSNSETDIPAQQVQNSVEDLIDAEHENLQLSESSAAPDRVFVTPNATTPNSENRKIALGATGLEVVDEEAPTLGAQNVLNCGDSPAAVECVFKDDNVRELQNLRAKFNECLHDLDKLPRNDITQRCGTNNNASKSGAQKNQERLIEIFELEKSPSPSPQSNCSYSCRSHTPTQAAKSHEKISYSPVWSDQSSSCSNDLEQSIMSDDLVEILATPESRRVEIDCSKIKLPKPKFKPKSPKIDIEILSEVTSEEEIKDKKNNKKIEIVQKSPDRPALLKRKNLPKICEIDYDCREIAERQVTSEESEEDTEEHLRKDKSTILASYGRTKPVGLSKNGICTPLLTKSRKQLLMEREE